MVKIERVDYFGLPNCFRLANGTVEVIVTTDIGPRVIAYRFEGGENILAEMGPDATVSTEWGDWHPWGGHRLWHAPEAMPRSYVPDNSPVTYELLGDDSISLVRPAEEQTGIEKEMILKLDAEGSRVTILHTLTNRGVWPVELAPWALTIMNGGGVTIIPNEPYISHDDYLLPARPVVMWHFTNLSDPRWTFGPRFVRLRTDERLEEPQKIGVGNKQGWAAYLREGTLFVKHFDYVEGLDYPDYGCNCETYTSGTFMEIESLGAMAWLEPGESTDHLEQWHLFQDVKHAESDNALADEIIPLIEGK